MLAGGGYVITWSGQAPDSTNYEIYGQRYSAAGVPLGGETRIDTSEGDVSNGKAVVTALTDGGYVVAWTHSQASTVELHTRRYDANGQAVTADAQITDHPSTFQNISQVVALSDGGYAVVWGLYARVAAIAFVGNSIELRYVWPRPVERLEPEEILSAEYEQSVRTYDDYAGPLEYQLQLRTRRGDRDSFHNPSLDEVLRVLRRIEAMKAQRATQPKSPARSTPSPAR